MPDNFKQMLFKRWASMPQTQRTVLAIVAIMVTIIGIGSLFVKDIKPITKSKDLSDVSLTLPGSTSRNLTNEALAAKIDNLIQVQKTYQDDQKKSQIDMNALATQVNTLKQSGSQAGSGQPDVNARTEPVETQKTDPLDPSLNLPVDQSPSAGPVPVPDVPVKMEVPIRVIASAESKTSAEDALDDDEKNIEPYLPLGSMFDAVFINGMDAPTSQVSMKTPVPSLLRVKSDAILPNEYRKDVRECFVIVSGFGVLSTERAQLRTENISCIRKDGGVIEAKLNGYVVGEDGKVGVRGRLVSRQGQLIAQSLLVGFVQGIGNAMQPMSVPALNLSPSGTQQYQMPSGSMMAMSGMAGGVSNAANTIAKFYMTLANDMFPIIELDAGRKVTIILTSGLKFDLSGKYKLTSQNAAAAPSVPANSTGNDSTVPMKQVELPAMQTNTTGMPQGINPQ